MVSRYLLEKKGQHLVVLRFLLNGLLVGRMLTLPTSTNKYFHSRWVCPRHFVISRVEGECVCCVVVVVGYAEFDVVGYAECEFTGFRAFVWVPCHRLTSL